MPTETKEVCIQLAEELFNNPETSGGGMDDYMLSGFAGHFMTLMCRKVVDHMSNVHAWLVEKGHTSNENQFDYNDLDDNLFVVPHNKLKVVVYRDQNCRYIYVIDTACDYDIEIDYDAIANLSEEEQLKELNKGQVDRLSIYRYWDVVKDEPEENGEWWHSPCRDWNTGEFTMANVLSGAEDICQYHSDSFEGSEGRIRRPPLSHFLNNLDKLNDYGWEPIVTSLPRVLQAEKWIHNYSWVKAAIDRVYGMICNLDD